jgi:hypothetical protein
MDAGLLDTDTPCGVTITNEQQDILSLKPDCAVMALNLILCSTNVASLRNAFDGVVSGSSRNVVIPAGAMQT